MALRRVPDSLDRAQHTVVVFDWSERLYDANGKTWDSESNIRKGQLGEMSLEEIGRTAIAIRESNGVRIRIKSEIVKTTGIGYTDIKINHASLKTYQKPSN